MHEIDARHCIDFLIEGESRNGDSGTEGYRCINTPQPGFEPGSEAPEAPRISTTLPGHRELMFCCLIKGTGITLY